ncbi:Peroxisomal targeting signal 2 receptor [Cryptotermes secundus]|uniref:Peroxin-7 n=1 Tax=Cryptotermes secundus TaxID=105785 RepID=A0A2J7PZB1_9NEOP|nr:Peroxisomal targeting signal 2 receptor [Cryptotermes secundus]
MRKIAEYFFCNEIDTELGFCLTVLYFMRYTACTLVAEMVNIGQSNIDSLFIIDLFRSAGGGTLFLLEVVPDNGLVEVACTQWSDGLFDVAWSETDANIIVSASGDGGLQLWNMSCPQITDSYPQAVNIVNGMSRPRVINSEFSNSSRQELPTGKGILLLVTVAERSKACTIFARSETEIVGSNPTQGMDVCVCLQLPPQTFREHKKEVYSVDWSQTRQEQFVLSASWDCSTKLWDPNRPNSLATFLGHTQLVYSAMWSPHVPSCFASVSGDGTMKVWNTHMPQHPSMSLRAHDAEVLSCDWCKYDQNILATGGSDGLIRGWDLRNITSPVFEQKGCEYAVRRVRFSPHNLSVLASVSYDFTTRIWDFKASPDPLETVKHHSEFVYGLDFNDHVAGQIADCGWDSLVHVFSPRSLVSLSSALAPPVK